MLDLSDFFAGWIGGVAGLIVGHPMDTIKVRQQALGESLIKTISRTIKHEGFLSFYHGFSAPFFTIGPTNAVFFQVYANTLKFFKKESTSNRVDINETNWILHVTCAGCVAGFAQVMVTCPVELVKIVMQTKTTGAGNWKLHYVAPYNTTRESIAGIFKQNGIPGFYKGLTPMLWRDVPSSSLYMITYELLLPRGDNPPEWQKVVAGGVAGMASWAFVIPFDVVKTKMQSDSPTDPLYRGMINCFHKVYKEEGPGTFMKGFWLNIIRSFPVNAAILYGYETFSAIFKRILN